MKSIDLSPLYRSSIGFDNLANMLDSTLTKDASVPAYPPYNIEVLDENRYAITLAVAGFTQSELDIQVDSGVLSICGNKADKSKKQFLHQGIANRTFERKFNLADHIEVINADLTSGLLTISLKKEVPEALKPKTIAINSNEDVLDHKDQEAA